MDGFSHELVVVNLEDSTFVGTFQRALEVFGDHLLTKLLLDTVDDGHDTLDVTIKNVAFLETLECNLALVLAVSPFPIFRGHDGEAFLGDVVHDRGRPLVGRHVSRPGLAARDLG